jgi:hypothetical protein
VIKEFPKKFARSLCVTSCFVALLDEKAGNPSFQPPGGRQAQVHKSAAILPALDGYAAPRGRRPKRMFRTFNLEKEKQNLWQFVE